MTKDGAFKMNLELKIRPSPCCDYEFSLDQNMTSFVDRIKVMKKQEETTYKCRDCIGRRSLRKANLSAVSSSISMGGDIRKLTVRFRQKMCEWSFSVVDHYKVPREIVAIAYSFLDLFLDWCDCDRAVFKLAAMTALYVATKQMSHQHISLTTLVHLSRNEFDIDHFGKMERTMLDSVEWRVNPPTVKSFIDQLMCLIAPKVTICQGVYNLAQFFAELSVIDYFFVNGDAYTVALSSILNAVEELCQWKVMKEVQDFVFRNIELCAAIDSGWRAFTFDVIRKRLWKLYIASKQCSTIATPYQ